VDGQARRVLVKIGVRRDALVEIVEGLSAGDQVVTAGMRLSRDGQPVRILQPGTSPIGTPAVPKTPGKEKSDSKAAPPNKAAAQSIEVSA
jgi:hypothetical protein